MLIVTNLKVSLNILWDNVLRLRLVLTVHNIHVQTPLLQCKPKKKPSHCKVIQLSFYYELAKQEKTLILILEALQINEKGTKTNRRVVSPATVWDERVQSSDGLPQSVASLELSASAHSSVTNWHWGGRWGGADVAALRGLMQLHVDEHQVIYNLHRLPSA